ncbi:MAG: YbgA family protein [Candidatus Ratteibacteria bacterium]
MSKPKIVLSRCFLEPVRYNGQVVNDDFVNKLKNFVDILDFCPEVGIGLGIPRDYLIIVKDKNSKKLLQPKTGLDFTDRMLEYVKRTVNSLSDIDGAILKAKSPSCGVSSSIIYEKNLVIGKGNGFFAEELKNKFPYLPIEDEGRLRNLEIRHHFLTKIFAFSELRQLISNPEPKKLVQFHTNYKFLLLTYNQKIMRELGKIVADGNIKFEEKIVMYRDKFYSAFEKRPSIKRHVNTLNHLYGFFSRRLTEKEKRHLLNLIKKFERGRLSLKVIKELLKSLAYRFENDYILFQKYIEPYPEDLEDA